MSVAVRRVTTDALTDAEIQVLLRLFAAAWPGGSFEASDWEHAKGGVHVIGEEDGEILSHASVVARTLEIDGLPIRTGYVEAVATWPKDQGRGFGSLVMAEIGDIIRADYALGGLSTGSPGFYARLGWEAWQGPSYVRTATGLDRTADDHGIMVLRTPMSPPFELTLPIACDWREGDVW